MFNGGIESYEQSANEIIENIISLEAYNNEVTKLFQDLNNLVNYEKLMAKNVSIETYTSIMVGVTHISTRLGISDKVVPAFENFKNENIREGVIHAAVEDFKEVAKTVVKKIVDFIKMIIKKLVELFDRLFGFSDKAIVRANEIKRQIQDIKTEPKVKIIKDINLSRKVKIADKSDIGTYTKTILRVKSLPSSTDKVFGIIDATSDTKLIESCGKMLLAVTTWLQSSGLSESDGDIISGDVVLMPAQYTFRASLNKKTVIKSNNINLESIASSIGGIKYFLTSVAVKTSDTDVSVLSKTEMVKLADLIIDLSTEYKNAKQKNQHLMLVLDTFVKRLETTQDKEVYGVCKLVPALVSRIINTNTKAMTIVCKSSIEYLENSIKQY